MRVSFIIPLYNCLALTQAMLTSLLATLPGDFPFEILLADDGSTDGTREWLVSLSDPRFRVLLNEKNLGYAATNNRAARLAQGERLVLLNNDLVLTRRWLEPMLDIESRGGTNRIVGNVQRSFRTHQIDHAGIVITAKGKPEHDRHALPWFVSARPAPATTGACVLVSRKLWEQLGGFDEAFMNGGEDVDFCFRARQLGVETWIALRSVVLHHVSASPGRKASDESNTRRLFEKWRDELAVFGARAWCRQFVHRDLTTATAVENPRHAWEIFAYAHGLTKSPPSVAIAGMHLALDEEMRRWKVLGR